MKTYTEGELLQNEQGEPLRLFGLEKTEMVFVEAGYFIMGERDNTTEINFKEGYFIGKYPVTQELYENVMGHNPSDFKGKHRPVEMVSWLDICEKQEEKESFLSKFNEKIQKNIQSLKGKGDFKLPSEAQWEYAARGGKKWNSPKLDFAGSQNIKDVAWYRENSNEHTMPVGLKQPNALGLYDMTGNVLDWCQDFSVENKNLNLIPKDGSPNLKFGVGRVLRGGGYFGGVDFCRVAYRYAFDPATRYGDAGFRLVFPKFIP